MIYSFLFSPAIDVCYHPGELVPGSTAIDVPARILPAGKGLNVARVVKSLGEDVSVIGIMPENNARQYEHYCEELGIEHHFFPVPGNVRVNMTVTEKNTGQVTHINSLGPELTPRMQIDFLDFARSRIVNADTLILTGSVPRGLGDDIYLNMIREKGGKGIRTVLDTRDEPLRLGLRAKPDVVKPNLSELETLFGEQIQGVRHIALKGKRLLDMGIPSVFVSLGSDGMIAVHENDCLLCSPPTIRVIDTVGCGDAVVAGIVVAEKRRFSFQEMCRMAVACGVSNALHAGPGNVDLDEIWQIMEDVAIQNV